MKRTGFIAIVGRPNVGKSTLLNSILGEKVAIVSNKPQTTRNRITGIFTKGEDQFVFLDTPGMHSPKNTLGEYMVKEADTTMREADAVILVVDAGRAPGKIEENVIDFLKKSNLIKFQWHKQGYMDNLEVKNAFILNAVFVSSILLPTNQHGFNLNFC